MKKKNLAFTLAEVLIVIGIIGVVAALTLPNLNHATGDKETVTRLQKAYSILNEANDRAVANYGPVSTWKFNEQCANNLNICWMKRIGEFLKISKKCDETGDSESDSYVSCNEYSYIDHDKLVFELPDKITFSSSGYNTNCDSYINQDVWFNYRDICLDYIMIDVNGSKNGKNQGGQDVFRFMLSDSLGIVGFMDASTFEIEVSDCMGDKGYYECSWWPLEYGNLDYLKADSTGKCNDSNIILDGTTNTSCH